MTNGRIKLTFESANWFFVTNDGMGIKGGHTATFNFLQSIRKHLNVMRTGPATTAFVIEPSRIAKFKAFCETNGIEVVGA